MFQLETFSCEGGEHIRVGEGILDMWLSCYSQEEIARELGITHQTVSNIITAKKRNLSQICNEPPESLREPVGCEVAVVVGLVSLMVTAMVKPIEGRW